MADSKPAANNKGVVYRGRAAKEHTRTRSAKMRKAIDKGIVSEKAAQMAEEGR